MSGPKIRKERDMYRFMSDRRYLAAKTTIIGFAVMGLALVCATTGPATAAADNLIKAPVEPVEQLAQGIVGRCSGIDPADFSSVDAFVDAVVAASGGFGSPAAEQNSVDCADTLQLAGEIRDIANPPVTIAIRRLIANCEAAAATIRTCSALRAILDKAILANSSRLPELDPPSIIIAPLP